MTFICATSALVTFTIVTSLYMIYTLVTFSLFDLSLWGLAF